jgi:WhiB family transcriptional regulator, redox-sensing transcriptional regulator
MPEPLAVTPMTVVNPLTSNLAALVVAQRTTPNGERRWQEQANCLGVDPDLFFPERGASTREAKAVCRSCEVQGDCLEYALAHGEKFGIWGGLSERERRRVRRARALERRGAVGA